MTLAAAQDLERIVRREHGNPHGVLGAHPTDGGAVVRAFRPAAAGVRVVTSDGDTTELEQVHPGGVFEGEPARSLPERRRKRSPLRDVAGMLRSFSYASIQNEAGTEWEHDARKRFLDAYLEHVDPNLLPAGQAAVTKLLSIFELEKAIYELRYELDNRPDWVPIPVAGITRILDTEVA